MPEHTPGESKGLFESLSMLVATLVATAHTRLELLSVDLEEEREHLFSIMLLAIAAMFLLGLGIVLASILLVVVLWESHRLLVLGLLTAFFLLLGAAVWAYALHKIRTKPRLFTSSLDELNKDHEQLSSRP
ncbi:MAG TPA: phage holin family protein [Gammaproteobacteria bacterium]